MGKRRDNQRVPFSQQDRLLVIGMGLYWAWFDAAVIGVYLYHPEYRLASAETNTSLAILLSSLLLGAVAASSGHLRRYANLQWFAVALTVCGIAGSVCTYFYARTELPAFLVGSVLLVGFYTSAMMLVWGRRLIRAGAKSTVVRVSGVFALGGLLNVLMYSLLPYARIVMIMVLPVASCVLLIHYLRRFPEPPTESDGLKVAATDDLSPVVSLQKNASTWFGVDVRFAIGILIFSFAMGFTQHVNLYSDLAIPADRILLVFVCRTVTGIVYIVGSVFFGWRPHSITMTSVIVLDAGFLLLLPLATVSSLGIPALVLITVGFAGFDVFLWVVLSEMAYYSSKSPESVLAFGLFCSRLALGAGYLFGALVVGSGESFSTLIVVCQMLSLLFSIGLLLVFTDPSGVWTMIKYGTAYAEPEVDRPNMLAVSEKIALRYGLTGREQEIIVLLAQDKSYLELAEHFHISLNTVKTHVAHVYSKMDVHTKGDLIELFDQMRSDTRSA